MWEYVYILVQLYVYLFCIGHEYCIISKRTYNVCHFGIGLFHWVNGLSSWNHFVANGRIPWSKYITVSLSVPLLMRIWVVPMSSLLWSVLLRYRVACHFLICRFHIIWMCSVFWLRYESGLFKDLLVLPEGECWVAKMVLVSLFDGVSGGKSAKCNAPHGCLGLSVRLNKDLLTWKFTSVCLLFWIS